MDDVDDVDDRAAKAARPVASIEVSCAVLPSSGRVGGGLFSAARPPGAPPDLASLGHPPRNRGGYSDIIQSRPLGSVGAMRIAFDDAVRGDSLNVMLEKVG